MTTLVKNRIESIDLLKGLVMIIMALDHTRDYFHAAAYLFDPTDPIQSTLPIFFTRWITHFCAPGFSFLAGLSAFMVGKRKTPIELSGFLWRRGLWLVFIELTVVNFGWFFDIHFRTFLLGTIWSLGISMVFLAAIIHLPRKMILLFSLIMIFGHDFLDPIHIENNFLWSTFHQFSIYKLSETVTILVAYPIVPWIAVMSLGYYFGSFYDKTFDPEKRKKLFNRIGISSIILFALLRYFNFYGNPINWIDYNNFSMDIISFMNPSKYPPSLLYLLMTLGASMVFLANTEKLKGKVVDFFCTFGRVPFFYYIIHIYLIHCIALITAQTSGFGWHIMILPTWVTLIPELKGYGYSLSIVYIIWISIIIVLYPLCKKFDAYKQSHKEKWYLSYL